MEMNIKRGIQRNFLNWRKRFT
ncbi:hypothetical protein ACHAW6_000478 [Cyclotella cf. meneghiniana]